MSQNEEYYEDNSYEEFTEQVKTLFIIKDKDLRRLYKKHIIRYLKIFIPDGYDIDKIETRFYKKKHHIFTYYYVEFYGTNITSLIPQMYSEITKLQMDINEFVLPFNQVFNIDFINL